ncbi:MAG: alanine--tRNA ligase [Candidatus Cloacimonetes bacterium]|nr:alanine--tRNA ligase [Candidatus Cloacimonadota bacterium]
MYTSKEIRQQFIDFFISKSHQEYKSAPVIPADDPTLLFTNAGMNQFKNIFLGDKKADYSRVVNSQKCIRAGGKHNDLEEVGTDSYHHTFFEMLGNWSFADYYKSEAISWAWELFTEVWKLPKDKLYATVHNTDQESFELWKKNTDIDHEHILYYGDKENFWEMGETGPCGPCSEIHYDRGENHCGKQDLPGHKCSVNGDCHRYIELWNLVFIQYFRAENGELIQLKNRFVDTGAGLERLCQILQGKSSNYDTDLFTPILNSIAEITSIPYSDKDGVSHRVIADHIRALTFAIADGGMPSNEGRGYVLRRILRRAARHGRLLGQKSPFLYKLVDTVNDVMGEHFSELREKAEHVKMIIRAEEERFNLTLDKGISKFEEIVGNTKGKILSGKDVFMLYDTYGFPLDLTRIMAQELGFSIDEKAFDNEMNLQKTRARNASNFKLENTDIEWIEYSAEKPTEFSGYLTSSEKVRIIKYSINDENEVIVVTDKTPFYAESGGQTADKGMIISDNCEISVSDVQKKNDQYLHFGSLQKGEITDSEYTAVIETEYRKSIARNHTATHLLHAALREVLGNHVHQKGSSVQSEHLRFDFTHFQQVTKRELEIVEKIVNERVRKAETVATEIMQLDEAKKAGATALFGEKYEDNVRVVQIGDFSKELCGGTHLYSTGEIGFFKIISESSVAAGVRRIEAITGSSAEEYVRENVNLITEISTLINTTEKNILTKIEHLLHENKNLLNEIQALKMKSANGMIDDLIAKSVVVKGVKLICAKVECENNNDLRSFGDRLRDKLSSGIGILLSNIGGKAAVLTIVTSDLTKKYQAGVIVNKFAAILGGKGGGRADMAMAGGKDTDKIDFAIQQAEKIISEL